MHVIVPTEDLLFLVSKMRPTVALRTAGLSYSVYTFEATRNKLKLYAGDGYSLLMTSEIFAEVKTPGKASVNGESFYQLATKIKPEYNETGSKDIELKATYVGQNKAKFSRLYLNTKTIYKGKEVKQNRWFQLVKEKLVDRYAPTPDVKEIDLQIKNLPSLMKQVVKMVSAYVSDIVGLSGVLVSMQDGQLKFVVSDGSRILELHHQTPIEAEDFAVLLPKTSCTLLQLLIGPGEAVKMYVTPTKVRFEVNTAGLVSTLTTHTITAQFPPYAHAFEVQGPAFTINRTVLYDNVINMRKALDDEVYRIILESNGEALSIKNIDAQAHVGIQNEDLPISDVSGGAFKILLNAFLFEGLLVIFENEDIRMTIGENTKPILLEESNEQMRVRAVLAQAIE